MEDGPVTVYILDGPTAVYTSESEMFETLRKRYLPLKSDTSGSDRVRGTALTSASAIYRIYIYFFFLFVIE